jgi:hypothetical protein
MEPRAERIARNQAVFREANERAKELAETLGLPDEPLDLVCECGSASCAERISMPRAEYEAVRADPRTFAIVPGHENENVEEVVERHPNYDVVRKWSGMPADFAETTDPRS